MFSVRNLPLEQERCGATNEIVWPKNGSQPKDPGGSFGPLGLSEEWKNRTIKAESMNEKQRRSMVLLLWL